MKETLLYFIVAFFLISCNQTKQENKSIVLKSFYSSARIKNIISLNLDSIKDGESFYFDEDGYLDSSIQNKNGKRNGTANKYYNDYGVYSYEYKNDTLISQSIYDTLNVLKYKTPIDLKTIGKTTIHLTSNRGYFDQDKGDTITIINAGLPNDNRGISITGALISRINDSVYGIRTSKHYDDLKKITFKISVFQHLGDTTEIPVIFDTISILAK